ncbi:MAG TPA: hypothetical protein VES73_10240 [Lamprocystis sp. (in: g-proteobacteria)]|nr:hypothetical protein [Lamprocystis sp. (in: g-proteobacteria)]
MNTGQELAIGTAAAVATGIAVDALSKHRSPSGTGTGPTGATGLQDLVDARASGGETQLNQRDYTNTGGTMQGKVRTPPGARAPPASRCEPNWIAISRWSMRRWPQSVR